MRVESAGAVLAESQSALLLAPIPLWKIAEQFGVTTNAVYRWKLLGRRNPYTHERIRAEFTWLPSGEWGMTQAQYTDFIARLNERA